jgi:hypothetical protein
LLDPLIGTRGSPEPRIDFELNLLLVRLHARLRDPERARSRFTSALALAAEHMLPSAHAMIATATLLAEGVGTPEDAETFAGVLAAAPASAKLAALRPFLRGSTDARMQIAIDLPEPTPGMLPQDQLSIAAALIFLGRPDQALLLLGSLCNPHARDLEVLAAVFRLARRVSPFALPPPADWTDIWISHATFREGADQTFAGVVLLEEADRRAAAGSTARALDLLEAAKPFLSELPSDSRWHELLSRLEALREEGENATAPLIFGLVNLPPQELFTPVTSVRIEVDSDRDQLNLDWLPQATAQISHTGAVLQSLISAARTNDLYPPDVGSILNQEGSVLHRFIVWFWKRLTGRTWRSTGVERVRREVRSILGARDAVAIEARPPALAAVPWELARSGSGRFYRTLGPSSNPDTMRYLRRAVERIWLTERGPGPTATWSEFVAALGGPEHFRHTLLSRVPPRDRPRALILQPDVGQQRRDRQGYGAFGLRLPDFYQLSGFDVVVLPINVKTLASALDGDRAPCLIHIAASIGETQTPREAFVRGDYGEPIRAEELTQAFLPRNEDSLRPLVILDVADDPFDRGRTLLLRNAFAARLFAEATRGILGIGPYPADSLEVVINALLSILKLEKLAVADLHRLFWNSMSHPLPPALFTVDPDLPVWD